MILRILGGPVQVLSQRFFSLFSSRLFWFCHFDPALNQIESLTIVISFPIPSSAPRNQNHKLEIFMEESHRSSNSKVLIRKRVDRQESRWGGGVKVYSGLSIIFKKTYSFSLSIGAHENLCQSSQMKNA